MEVAVESTWQRVRAHLATEGWQIGWAEYEDAETESVWLVQAIRKGVVELADGLNLDEAFSKLYYLTR